MSVWSFQSKLLVYHLFGWRQFSLMGGGRDRAISEIRTRCPRICLASFSTRFCRRNVNSTSSPISGLSLIVMLQCNGFDCEYFRRLQNRLTAAMNCVLYRLQSRLTLCKVCVCLVTSCCCTSRFRLLLQLAFWYCGQEARTKINWTKNTHWWKQFHAFEMLAKWFRLECLYSNIHDKCHYIHTRFPKIWTRKSSDRDTCWRYLPILKI